jgi:phage-related protein
MEIKGHQALRDFRCPSDHGRSYANTGIMGRTSKQPPRKPDKWVGSAKRVLDAMPDDVKDVFGHAIDVAQAGGKHLDAKVLAGFGSAGVLEVVDDHRGDTYRAVYTVKFAGWVYVLHCFQKKSRSGIKTPKEDMELVHARLQAAKLDFETWTKKQGAR